MSQQQIVRNSFQIPTLNIPPKSEQRKRMVPRSYLKATKKVKDSADQRDVIPFEGMKAYKEALLMLEQIRNPELILQNTDTDHYVEENVQDHPQIRAESSGKIEINIPFQKSDETFESKLNKNDSSKMIVFQNSKKNLNVEKEINQDLKSLKPTHIIENSES